MTDRPAGNPNWVKGVSGNPGGRPKDSVTAALRTYALAVDPVTGKTGYTSLAERLIELSHSKDPTVALRATQYVTDRLDGKPLEAVKVEGDSKLVVELVRVARGVLPTATDEANAD